MESSKDENELLSCYFGQLLSKLDRIKSDYTLSIANRLYGEQEFPICQVSWARTVFRAIMEHTIYKSPAIWNTDLVDRLCAVVWWDVQDPPPLSWLLWPSSQFSTWAVYEASCEWARVGGKRVIGLIAFRTRVSLIMLFSLSQSRCLIAALGSSSSYCPSYPCLLRHFPKITFGATTKPPPPSNPLPLEIVLTEGAEQGSRRRLYLESKGTCLALWLHCFVPRTSFIWIWTSVPSVTTRRSHIHGTKHEGSDQWQMCHTA